MPTETQSSRSNLPDGNPGESSHALNRQALERATSVLLFVGCLGYLWLFRHFTTIEPDEGIVLQGATRILDGQVPYRDFFTFYTPGSFYLAAAVFRIFGNSFVVARSTVAVAGALCSVVTYLLCRRACSRGISLFAAVLATIAGTAFRFLVLHNCYSTLMACLAVYAAVRFVETLNARWAFATGTLTTITFLFEQSKGGGLGLGLLLGFVLLRKSGLKSASATALGAGLMWPFVPTLAYFASHHALGDMVSGWLWPLRHYTAANHVPYGWQNWSDHSRSVIFQEGPLVARLLKAVAVSPGLVVPVLPLIGLALLVYWASRLRRDPGDGHARYYVAVCSGLAGLLLSVVIVRTDVLHFMYLTPLWYVVLAWVLGKQVKSTALQRVRPVLIAYVAFAFGMIGFAVLLASTGARTRIDTRRGIVATGAPDTVIAYVQSHEQAGDALLVYPYLPLYNYLTATRSTSRYDFFQPGMNTPDQALEVIASLESTHARAVLFEPWFAEKFANSWPDTPLSAITHDPVADYVVRNFRICQALSSPEGWRFEYRVRKGSDCP